MNDIGYSKMRLERILSSTKLNLNPYKLQNLDLIETLNNYIWGNSFEIVDCMIARFIEIQNIDWINPFKAIIYKIGDSEYEDFIPINRFIYGMKANDSGEDIYFSLNGHRFLSYQQVESLIGKRVFISHYIWGTDIWGKSRAVWRMHSLSDDLEHDAEVIRCEFSKAKIEMLTRMLNYPECSDYLFCDKNLFDIKTPITLLIEKIKNMSNV